MAKNAHKSPTKNPVETLETLDDSFLRTLTDEGKSLGKGFLDQIFGQDTFETPHTTNRSGDLHEGQEIHLSKHAAAKDQGHTKVAETARRADIAPGMEYHREIATIEQRASAKETAEIKQAIKDIQMELQKLVASSSMLQVEFSQVSMSRAPVTPGKYHINFFEWVLTVIRQARMRVEDAGAWQAALKSKKNKQGFWGRAKKEGTTFLLHHDRNVATQTG